MTTCEGFFVARCELAGIRYSDTAVSSNSPDQQFLRDIAKEVGEQGVRPRSSPQRVSAEIGFRFSADCLDMFFFSLVAFGSFILTPMIGFGGLAASWIFILVVFALAALYLSCNAWFERTLGKMLLGLRVICRPG